jgi:hypothetical protein
MAGQPSQPIHHLDATAGTRAQGRIQLPFEVELSHPSIGRIRSVVRDVSEGGLFVRCQAPALREGAKVKLTVLHSTLIEHIQSPTLEMQVLRIDAEGTALKFANRVAAHLWQSVRRLRDELSLGRDYFQVFQAALVTNRLGRLLLLQQNGRWLFPGCFLVVGQDWQAALAEHLSTSLEIDDAQFASTLGMDSAPDVSAPENATLSLFHHYCTDSTRARIDGDSRYRHAKWVGRRMELDELTFSNERLRKLARQVLSQLET